MRACVSRPSSRPRRSAWPFSPPTSCDSSWPTRASSISSSASARSAPTRALIGLRVDEVIPSLEKPLKQVAESGEMRFDEAFKAETRPTPTYINRIVSAVRGRFSGITQSLTVLIQDVTDQVNARREIEDLAQAMAERSARLDSILSSMTDGLWVYDAGGQVVSVNEAAITHVRLRIAHRGRRAWIVRAVQPSLSRRRVRFRPTICRTRARCAA